MAWANYSRQVAIDKKRERKKLGVGEREILNQAIQFATNYKTENKLDLALKSISDAEAIDPDSLPMLLKKAEILGAQGEFAKAFLTLDQYDLHAIDEEREKASSLRNELLFKQKSSLEDIKEEIKKAWTAGDYNKIHELSLRGLHAKDDDPELLYQAGTASIITRDSPQTRTFFTRYLTLTNTLDADVEQRAKVRTLLANVSAQGGPESGERNWLSGKRLPRNVFYCPISLALQQHIDHIEASGKMRVNYEWQGDQLVSITPTFEKTERATGERKIFFTYYDKFPQVFSVTEGEARPLKISTSDPDDVLKHSSLVVLNNPYIDPDSVNKLTGHNVTIGVSGNRFFEPFVWDRIHYFRFTYDSAGRVAWAREMTDATGTLSDFTLEFEWDGQQLVAVRGYQGTDAKNRVRIYDRVLQYEDGRLMSEEIKGSGKASRIKYNYNGDRMASAQCTTDSTLDDRARQVTFR